MTASSSGIIMLIVIGIASIDIIITFTIIIRTIFTIVHAYRKIKA